MQNFDYCTPTRLIFGKDSVEKLPEVMKSWKRILLTYGGGSIKKIGLYDKVKELLKDFEIYELSDRNKPAPFTSNAIWSAALGISVPSLSTSDTVI